MTGLRNTLRSVTTSAGSPHFAATSDRVTPSSMILVPQRIEAKAGEAARRPRTTIATPCFMFRTIGRFALTGNERAHAATRSRRARCDDEVQRTFSPVQGTH